MKSLLLILFVALSCSHNDREDEVPIDFTIRNESSVAIAAIVFSSRTNSIVDMPAILTDVEFAQHQVNPGITKEHVTAVGYTNGEGVYFQVYIRQDGVNGLVYSRIYNNFELIRQKKLLVYQSP